MKIKKDLFRKTRTLKGNSQNRGITLIALIITLIVLLILSGIAIVQLTGSGILEKAKLSKVNISDAQEQENSILNEYEGEINNVVSSRDENYNTKINRDTLFEGNNESISGNFQCDNIYKYKYLIINYGTREYYNIDHTLSDTIVLRENQENFSILFTIAWTDNYVISKSTFKITNEGKNVDFESSLVANRGDDDLLYILGVYGIY